MPATDHIQVFRKLIRVLVEQERRAGTAACTEITANRQLNVVWHARIHIDTDTGQINEISRWSEYDYVIINDDVQKAQAQLEAIVAAERLNRQRQTGLVDFVRRLTQG